VTPDLHPDAARNFDEKARVLLAAVAPESPQEPSEPPTDIFRPGGYVVATLGEGDYSEFKITGKNDRLGRTTARYFEHEGRRLGFEVKSTKHWHASQRMYRRPGRSMTWSALGASRTRSSTG